MSTYRPRPVEVRYCKHCNNSFETRHKRTIYCGDSCRQLAYQARSHSQEPQSKPVNGLTFSMNDIGVIAAGTTTTALGNYFLNDRPAQQVVLDKLASIEKGTEQGLNQLLGAAQMMVDFVNVQLQNNPGLAIDMHNVQAKRVAEKQHRKELKEDTVNRVLSRRSQKRS